MNSVLVLQCSSLKHEIEVWENSIPPRNTDYLMYISKVEFKITSCLFSFIAGVGSFRDHLERVKDELCKSRCYLGAECQHYIDSVITHEEYSLLEFLNGLRNFIIHKSIFDSFELHFGLKRRPSKRFMLMKAELIAGYKKWGKAAKQFISARESLRLLDVVNEYGLVREKLISSIVDFCISNAACYVDYMEIKAAESKIEQEMLKAFTK